jgi:hypothetical protein
MAITFVQGNHGFSTTPSIGFAGSVTKGNLLIMLWGCSFGGGTPQDLGFSDSIGSVYHDQGPINSDLGFNPGFAMGWAIAAATGACTVSSRNVTANNGYTLVCAEFSGVSQIENYTSGGSSAQVSPSFFTSPTITPSQANSLVVCLDTIRQGVAVGAFTGTWTSGFTVAAQNMGSTGVGCDIGYKILTAAAATTATETVTNSGTSGQNNGRMTIMDFVAFGTGLLPLNVSWLAW